MVRYRERNNAKKFGRTYGKKAKDKRVIVKNITNLHVVINNITNCTYISSTNNTATSGNGSSSLDLFDKLKADVNNQVQIISSNEFLCRQETLSSFDTDANESSLKLFKDSYGHSSKDFSSGNLALKNPVLHVKKRKPLATYNGKRPQIQYVQNKKTYNRNTSVQRSLSTASSTPNRPHIIPSPNSILDYNGISPIIGVDINTIEDVFETETNRAPEIKNNADDMSGLLKAFHKIKLSTSSPFGNKENFKPSVTTNSSPDKSTPWSIKSSLCLLERSNQEIGTPLRSSNNRLRSSKSAEKNPPAVNNIDGSISAFLGFDTEELRSKCEEKESNVMNQTPLRSSNNRLRSSKSLKKNPLAINNCNGSISAFLGFDTEELSIKCEEKESNVMNQNSYRFTDGDQLKREISFITDQNLSSHKTKLSLQSGKQWRRSMLAYKSKVESGVRKNTLGPEVIAQLLKDAKNIDAIFNRSQKSSFMNTSQLGYSAKENVDFSVNMANFEFVSVRKRGGKRKKHEGLGPESFSCYNANLMEQIKEEDSYEADYNLNSSNKKLEDNAISNDEHNTSLIKHNNPSVIDPQIIQNSVNCSIENAYRNSEPKENDASFDKSPSVLSGSSQNSIEKYHSAKGSSSSGPDEYSCTNKDSPRTVQARFINIPSPLMFNDDDKNENEEDYDEDNSVSEASCDHGQSVSALPALCEEDESVLDGDNEDDPETSAYSSDRSRLETVNYSSSQAFEDDLDADNEDEAGTSVDSSYQNRLESDYSSPRTFEGNLEDNNEDEDKISEEYYNDPPSREEKSEEYYNDSSFGDKISEAYFDDHSSGDEKGEECCDDHSGPENQELRDDLLVEEINHIDEREWGRLGVLSLCGLTAPLPFSEAFSEEILKNCCKLGEGSYSEVFLLERPEGKSVLKIIPVEGSEQKTFDEILSELIITDKLSSLRDNIDYFTTAFCEIKNKFCLIGKYPSSLITRWNEFAKEKVSENQSPDDFGPDQLFIAMELAHSGTAAEDYCFNSATQSHSAFLQTVLALAVAEAVLEFEHRDMHVGNVLLQSTKDEYIHFTLDNSNYSVKTFGVQVTIIDFTLSRLSLEGGTLLYYDLNQDPLMFEGDAEYDFQFEVYRLMREDVNANWQQFKPKTNIRWLEYLIDKLINKSKYKKTKKNREHKSYLLKLNRLKKMMKESSFSSSWELARSLFAG